MNKHIKELAVRCGAWNQVYNNKEFMVDRTFDVEKFANLIIEECQQIVLSNSYRDDDMGAIIANKIKRYFGVEE
jgi:hypothetical protein